jgi:hypothetical protein
MTVKELEKAVAQLSPRNWPNSAFGFKNTTWTNGTGRLREIRNPASWIS